MKSIRWENPCNGWIKINTDGSSLGNPGMAGGGGLIKDENGDWVVGFARKIGTASRFMAELLALRDGLLLCLQFHAQAVIIGMDTKVIIDALSSHAKANTIVSSIMENCRRLIAQIPQARFNHVYKEANKCADFPLDFTVFSSPLVDLFNIWEADSRGLCCNRLCPDPSFAA